MARSKVKSGSHNDISHMHSSANVPTKCQLPTPLRFLRYGLETILKVKVTTARSNVKLWLYYDVAHLHPLPSVPTKYQLPTPYGDIARQKF